MVITMVRYTLKININLEDETDIKHWSSKEAQSWLLNDLSHNFDIAGENIKIKMHEDHFNGPMILKFIQDYAKDLDEQNIE